MHAVQTHVVQGSTAYSFVDYGMHISYQLITLVHTTNFINVN